MHEAISNCTGLFIRKTATTYPIPITHTRSPVGS